MANPVNNSTQSPWKFVGLWLVNGNPGGSGVLIGEKYVLTAGHVYGGVDIAGGIRSTDQSYFHAAYLAGSSPFGSAQVDPIESRTYNTYVTANPNTPDIAAVRVQGSTSIPTSELPGLVLFINQQDAVGKNVSSAGYPISPSPGTTMYSMSGSITKVRAEGIVNLSSSMAAGPGYSGGPLYYQDDGKTYVAGVITGQDGVIFTETRGTIFTPNIYNNILGALYSTEKDVDPQQLPTNLILGSTSQDNFKGTHRNEKIVLSGGGDTVLASGGRDEIIGGDGKDEMNYDLPPAPIMVAGGSEVPLPPFENLVATLKGGAVDPGTVTVSFDDPYGRTLQKICEVEKIILSGNEDKLVIEAGARANDTILFDAAGQIDGKDVLDFSQYGKPVYLGAAKGGDAEEGKYELYSDEALKASSHIQFKNFEEIRLTAKDDIVRINAPGLVVKSGGGADDIQISNNIGIADLSPDDRITIAGEVEYHGGTRYVWSESPWATSFGGLFKSGINDDGELVVRAEGLGTVYVLNWQASGGMSLPLESRPGHITVAEYDVGAYQLFDPNKPSHMTVLGFLGLGGTVFKATFGVETWGNIDPLTLDLDGDGIELINASSVSPRFDLDGDLYAERTGWVQADDGILVRDLDGDGAIDDVTEMFGGRTSGFAALAALDGNQDGKVDALDDGLADFNGDSIIDQDDTFATLQVWRDLNENAATDQGELFSLESLGIESISVSATPEDELFVSGNQITATGAFTRTDGSTGTIADVHYHLDNQRTTYVGDPITITAQAEALPDHKGFGTLVSLREAMSLDAGFATIVENTLPNLTAHGLAALRMQALPILTGWALASPLGDGDRDPNTSATKLQTHSDVPILVADGPFGRDEVIDYAFQTTATLHDQNGNPYGVSYWALASGASVKDANGQVIDHPTLNELLASSQARGAWTVLDGDLIALMERFLGEELPLDRIMPEGQGSNNDAIGLLTQILTAIDLAAVRIAVQGGALSSYFTSITYDAETNGFHAAAGNDRELIPVFESIFADARDNSHDAAWIGGWKPLLDVVIGDFSRGESYLLNSYGFLGENIVAAYENTGLAREDRLRNQSVDGLQRRPLRPGDRTGDARGLPVLAICPLRRAASAAEPSRLERPGAARRRSVLVDVLSAQRLALRLPRARAPGARRQSPGQERPRPGAAGRALHLDQSQDRRGQAGATNGIDPGFD